MSSGNPEQERAKRFEDFISGYEGPNIESMIAVAFAAEEVALAVPLAVAAERAECAKIMCEKCRDGEIPNLEHGKYCHDVFVCRATKIHERGRR